MNKTIQCTIKMASYMLDLPGCVTRLSLFIDCMQDMGLDRIVYSLNRVFRTHYDQATLGMYFCVQKDPATGEYWADLTPDSGLEGLDEIRAKRCMRVQAFDDGTLKFTRRYD